MRIEELRAKKADLIGQTKAILDKASAENREMTDAETEQVKALTAQSREVGQEVEKAQDRANARATAQAEIDAMEHSAGRVVEDAVLPATPMVAREGFLSDPRRGFRTMGEFALAVKAAGPEGVGADARLRSLAAATGLNQSIGAEGGFATPPSFAKEIWDGLNTGDAVSLLDLTDSYPVDGESLTLPAVNETSRANGSRYGGVRHYWLSEAGQITSSKTALRNVKIEPHQLGVLVYATDKLLRNAPALGAYLTKSAVGEIRFGVNDGIVNGTGAGQPKGLLTSGSLVSVAKETSQAAATVVTENLVKMMARIHPNSRSRMRWLANVDVEPQLMLSSISIRNVAGSDNVGGSAVPAYNSAAGTLLGKPIDFVESCATLGTVGDIIAWDPAGYVSGVQQGLEEAVSIHLRFDYAETAFRFLYAVDGQPWLQSALTPFKGTNTLSTHVALATRS